MASNGLKEFMPIVSSGGENSDAGGMGRSNRAWRQEEEGEADCNSQLKEDHVPEISIHFNWTCPKSVSAQLWELRVARPRQREGLPKTLHAMSHGKLGIIGENGTASPSTRQECEKKNLASPRNGTPGQEKFCGIWEGV